MENRQIKYKLSLCILVILLSCTDNKNTEKLYSNTLIQEKVSLVNTSANTVKTRFNIPEGFIRKEYSNNTFENYLINFPLLPDTSQIVYYNGKIKNKKIHAAVLNMDIGNKDLQQCADAVMRLRGEYLFKNKKYSDIHFNLTNGFNAEYTKWAEGYRIQMNGNKSVWIKKYSSDYSYKNFKDYIFYVFNYAGTLSLNNELKTKEYKDLAIGDVLIQGGSPGHAMLVMDVAENPKSNKKIYLLAQSYMPAQSIHIVSNMNNSGISPWYELNEKDIKIYTPEWIFNTTDLKCF